MWDLDKLSDLLKVMDWTELGLEVMIFALLQSALEKLPPFCLPRMTLQSNSGQSQLHPLLPEDPHQDPHQCQ